MNIIFEPLFKQQLLNILDYIAKDKKSASIKFKNELQFKISQLKTHPNIYRKSLYFDDENIRDLIYDGYTIIYEIQINSVHILDIFKWQYK
ncbi:MAG: hypothetical protein A3E21_06675 [Sulfurimonas sp. RIFCSPHIGHO2_12_FULL_36_9]|uniref:type II toxin-antitoxin system RelE/ParE family toxin n=1 Tax=Sulfurimonas sp. RIFCSPLOWO2_12_36_12 TaxID=1802253 RepID=UPI0008ACE86D|nr:MAG: hypothetical protein A3J26_02415 [Sulfurimonas sp. RIFCSPLOWO2_02_FULL_36_28]OHD99112.1 MAG: hypothetical protein A3E21_06675 [Sulfurimonas sp. RIFCSPHIGHO2_12_FULL_36_9]OHE02192.1 MAG: hypothetical protein A2W82_01290 [Sulfurimonas sp. RIFCSPLOWO2_12_36_12]OHE06200.1 MAG: hypothetical protein A3K14_09300 [Sulfurimonas sp. RIFCSPLOWO2_12_FULL_36_74]